MEGERLATLEQALAELQAKDANTQHKLDILISHIPQSENPIPSTQITSVTPKAHGLKPALPSEFDGDRTKGMAFLNSCQVYIRLCPNSFMDEQAKIVWAMSYMKAGRAAKWSACVFRWEEQPENVGYHKFVDWEDFRDKFKREFYPVRGARTINTLRPLETLFRWTLTLVRKRSRSRSCATDVERQDTRHPTVLPHLTSES